MALKIITRHINRLLLDPNNYRFIDHEGYKKTAESYEQISRVQKRTASFLLGKNNENVQDLLKSFRENGILPVNYIQVKEIEGPKPNDTYCLVLEGNRRVAALKYLYMDFKERQRDIGRLTEPDFKSIPLVLHTSESVKDHLVTMGLEHITGKKRWNPYNQAQLIEDLIITHQLTEEEVVEKLGITKHALRRARQTLYLINAYKKSDFGDQFKSTMYSLFEEVIKSIDLKNWLNWDDNDYKPANQKNTERIFSWISSEEIVERDDKTSQEISCQTKEPIITKVQEFRDVAKYINDPAALVKMEESRSVTQGYVNSSALGESILQNALENLNQDAQAVFNFSKYLKPDHVKEINHLRDKLDRLTPSASGKINAYQLKNRVHVLAPGRQFKKILIKKYRKLVNLELKYLNKINIFAGKNNSGKTSILEAVYLNSQHNAISALLELEQYRGRFGKSFSVKWLDRNMTDQYQFESEQIDTPQNASLILKKSETTDAIDKTAYLATIQSQAVFGNNQLENRVHLFTNREPELYYEKTAVLCNGALTSPYRQNTELLLNAHSIAVQNGFIDQVITFIKTNIDPAIQKIEMVDIEGMNRFYVQSNKFTESIDITKYGEGVQRIFEIALLFAYCKDGILCIDEFESAVHYQLLLEFTQFIQQLAIQFNVQVFLSTHSKECIDAFVENGFQNEDITGFALADREDGYTGFKYIPGSRLAALVKSIDLDIRGDNG